MERRKQPSTRATWGLVVVVPILAGGAAWLVADLTVSTEACSTGSGGHYGGGVEFAALVMLLLAAPVAIVWHARRARPFLPRIVVPVVISILLAVVLIFVGARCGGMATI